MFRPFSSIFRDVFNKERPKHIAVCTVMTRGVGSVRSRINLTMKFAKVQAVSRRPLTAKARVRSQVSPCEICGARSGSGSDVSPSTSLCSAPYSFDSPWLHITERLRSVRRSEIQLCKQLTALLPNTLPSKLVFCDICCVGNRKLQKWAFRHVRLPVCPHVNNNGTAGRIFLSGASWCSSCEPFGRLAWTLDTLCAQLGRN